MDTRQLRYFSAVCRFRNLSHAADHCYVATSALSRHIVNLEAELGTKLFTRKPRGMEPTAAGLRLLAHAEGILNAVDTAVGDIRHGQAEVAGHIAVGIPYSVINVIGVDVMQRVLEDYPRVRLLIREGLSGVTYNSLKAGEIEMAFAFNPPVDDAIEREALLEEELFCIGHASIIGATTAAITLEEMAELPVVLLQSGVLSRALLDKPAALARLEEAAKIQLASVAATLSALKGRLGCTLAPRVLVSELIHSGRLHARPVVAPKPVRTLYLVTPAQQQPTQLNETISALLKRLVRQAVTDGRWEAAQLIGATR